jgi:hypothetical protein
MFQNTIELELANECYGYGRWEAKFWFVGLEQGQAKEDNNDVTMRNIVFKELASDGLCDSATFHNDPRINEPWHRDLRTPLQATWRSLILILKSYLSEDFGTESRRKYQRDHWGRSSGDVCVIERSGLPANNLSITRDRKLNLSNRIAFIKQKIEKHSPSFVVMYGTSGISHWETIAGRSLKLDIPVKVGATAFLCAKHPTDFFEKGQKKNQYYAMLGTSLRGA